MTVDASMVPWAALSVSVLSLYLAWRDSGAAARTALEERLRGEVDQARDAALAASREHRRQCEQDFSSFGERLTVAFARVDEMRAAREALAERVTRVEAQQAGAASGLARVEASAAAVAGQINALAREVSEDRGGRR